jgi:hypothetical protein
MRCFLLLAILLAATSAQAEEGTEKGSQTPPSLFKCDPPSFTLQQEKDGYHLEAALEVPTPGYRYQFEQTSSGLVLRITPPEGMAAQVISTLAVSYVLPLSTPITELTVTPDRGFDGGISAITCRIVG